MGALGVAVLWIRIWAAFLGVLKMCHYSMEIKEIGEHALFWVCIRVFLFLHSTVLSTSLVFSLWSLQASFANVAATISGKQAVAST